MVGVHTHIHTHTHTLVYIACLMLCNHLLELTHISSHCSVVPDCVQVMFLITSSIIVRLTVMYVGLSSVECTWITLKISQGIIYGVKMLTFISVK